MKKKKCYYKILLIIMVCFLLKTSNVYAKSKECIYNQTGGTGTITIKTSNVKDESVSYYINSNKLTDSDTFDTNLYFYFDKMGTDDNYCPKYLDYIENTSNGYSMHNFNFADDKDDLFNEPNYLLGKVNSYDETIVSQNFKCVYTSNTNGNQIEIYPNYNNKEKHEVKYGDKFIGNEVNNWYEYEESIICGKCPEYLFFKDGFLDYWMYLDTTTNNSHYGRDDFNFYTLDSANSSNETVCDEKIEEEKKKEQELAQKVEEATDSFNSINAQYEENNCDDDANKNSQICIELKEKLNDAAENANSAIDEYNSNNFSNSQINETIGDYQETVSRLIASGVISITWVEGCAIFGDLTDEFAKIFKTIKLLLVGLLIVLTILDFMKALASDKDDEFKKAGGKLIKRFAIIVVIFLLPILIQILLGIFLGNIDACLGTF